MYKRQKLEGAGLSILSEGDIASEDIDSKKLVDQHYYAIASKATITPPAELAVPEATFKEFFGEEWQDVLADGRAMTAIDACKNLGLSGAEMDEAWGKAKGAGDIIKLGGGFYCGKLMKGDTATYTFNAFYMSMRDRFTQPGGSIHYFAVEWDASTLPWADFRGKLLGPTDPAAAPADSIRGLIYSDWKNLGLSGEPNTGDNGVHASASPFEALAEKMNWLQLDPKADSFGAEVLGLIGAQTLGEWKVDPQVILPDGGGKRGSVFDQLEDSDRAACAAKLGDIGACQNAESKVVAAISLMRALAWLSEGGGAHADPCQKAALGVQVHFRGLQGRRRAREKAGLKASASAPALSS